MEVPRLDLKLLRTFLAVARHKSYTRAAEELALTQPGVSIHVKRLEQVLGVPLFEQVGQRVQLTTAGEVLVRAGTQLIGDASRIERRLADLSGGTVGRLRVGASSVPGIYLLPKVLARFVAEAPDVQIQCVLGRTLEIEEMLLADTLDCALVGGHLASRDIAREKWLSDEVVLVCGRSHPLASRARGPALTRAELAAARFIYHAPGSATRQCLDAWLASRSVKPRVLMELGSVEAVKEMVKAGLGIAGVSHHSLSDDLVLLPASGQALKRHLWILHHPAKTRCPVVKKFRTVARTFV